MSGQWIKKLRPEVQKFASRLQSRFPKQFENDENAAPFKKTVVQCVKAILPPQRRPGRPPDENVTRAINMRAKGKNWSEIFAALIKPIEPESGFSSTFAESQNAKFDLSVAKSRLRSAVRSRLKRCRALGTCNSRQWYFSRAGARDRRISDSHDSPCEQAPARALS
jgi:hypothetical protein